MDFEIVNQLDRDQWKEFVDRHPEGNIFHTPDMFDVYSQTLGYKPLLWAALGGEGKILALHIPVRITLRGGLLHYLTTRNVNFGSVLVEDGEAGKAALSLLLEKYNEDVSTGSLFTELRNMSDLREYQEILEQYGYQYEPHLNYFLDINRDPYDILQNFRRTTRQQIRKSIRNGDVMVKEITEPGMLPLFYELIKMTYTYVRVPLADISLFQSAFNLLFPKQMARFTIAYVHGVPAAATVTVLYKKVMYGWYNGVNRSFRPNYPNEFIIWDMIRWGAENGYHVLDFGGAGNPEEESGVRDFKLKFRGNLIEFGRNFCIHAPHRMKLAENTYLLGRKVIRSLSTVSDQIGEVFHRTE